MQTFLYGVEDKIQEYLNEELEKYIHLKPHVNFDSEEFSEGYLLITNSRMFLLQDNGEYFSEYIQDISCLIVYFDENNTDDLIIKICKENYTTEILLKSKNQIKKIMKKIAKYYEYITNLKVKVYKSVFQDFTNEKTIEYLKLCYVDLIETHMKFLEDCYTLKDFTQVKLLGEGSNGKVYLFKNIKENKLYAVKVINKMKILEERTIRYLVTEKFVMEHIQNEFLLSLKGFFQTERNLYFVTNRMETDLFGLLKNCKVKSLSEDIVAFYAICTAVALQCLHDHNFTYRDLKPENILIDELGYPLLCDFGLVDLLIPTHKAYTMCGTPEFFAPEVIASTSYDERIDWWSLGVFIFELLFGYVPFSDENTYTLYEKILNSPVEFPTDVIISDSAKDLVLRLLEKNRDKRLGAKKGIYELFNHKFFKKINIDKIIKRQVKPPLQFPKFVEEFTEEEIDENLINPLSKDELIKLKANQNEFEILN